MFRNQCLPVGLCIWYLCTLCRRSACGSFLCIWGRICWPAVTFHAILLRICICCHSGAWIGQSQWFDFRHRAHSYYPGIWDICIFHWKMQKGRCDIGKQRRWGYSSADIWLESKSKRGVVIAAAPCNIEMPLASLDIPPPKEPSAYHSFIHGVDRGSIIGPYSFHLSYHFLLPAINYFLIFDTIRRKLRSVPLSHYWWHFSISSPC